MRKSRRITFGALVVVAAIASLFALGFRGNTGYQMAISDIVRQGESLGDRYLLVEGRYVEGTAQFDSQAVELRFTVTDGETRMPVLYHGVEPDNLDYPDAEIILKGKYDASAGLFFASEVQTRCPSKYEAADGESPRLGTTPGSSGKPGSRLNSGGER